MSWWTFVTGVIRVSTPARTTEQAEYIVKTVLNRLPQVTGSERNMRVSITPSLYEHESQDWDEFGKRTKNLVDGYLDIYPAFLLTVEGDLRDMKANETYREFVKWLCRLAKRIGVDDVCVKITDNFTKEIMITNPKPYSDMYEIPPRWVERIEGPKWWQEFEEPQIYRQPKGSGQENT